MSIFTHVTVGASDLERARKFYDQVLEPLGLKRIRDIERGSGWGVDRPEFFILRPLDGKPATAGNGVTVSFAAKSPEAVDAFYRRALELGGKDEGAPGPRAFAPNAYAAYVRDPEGNKLAVIHYA
ncbi:MAG TPA: VOC family protein [Sphingomonadales bacterium]